MTADVPTEVLQDECGVVAMVAGRNRLDVLTGWLILDYLTKEGAERGFTLHRTFERRYNDEGEQIGPDRRISTPQIRHLERAAHLVRGAIDQAFDEMMGAA